MRLLGILALLLGIGGTVYAADATFRARRPMDLAWAIVAPLAAVVAIVGLVTVVSPSFLAE